ncbi:hypothetical protein ABVT39_006155 [Epinephelus coioides]
MNVSRNGGDDAASRKTHRDTLMLITPYSAVSGSKTAAAAPVGAEVEMTIIMNHIRCISSLNASCVWYEKSPGLNF